MVNSTFNYTTGWDLLYCDEFDDDTELSVSICGPHDLHQCEAAEDDEATEILNYCPDACSSTLMDEELT